MRSMFLALPLCLMSSAYAADAADSKTGGGNGAIAHRYMIERTFPAGALDGVDAAAKKKVNANNSTLGVTWVQSYANADKTKTFCEYEAPSEAAVRQAAKLNGLPVDKVTEVPVKSGEAKAATVVPNYRYIVEQTGKVDSTKAHEAADAEWVTSYASADKTKTYSIYQAPNAAAARDAALSGGAPVDSVTEVPVTLAPN